MLWTRPNVVKPRFHYTRTWWKPRFTWFGARLTFMINFG